MRNLFDQYDQPENRLTHALACTLAHDRAMIRPFLRWCGATAIPPAKRLRIAEQQVPGEPAEDLPEDKMAGLPDLCVYSDDGWAAAFEAKVQSAASAHQLARHRQTLARYQFKPQLFLVTVDRPRRRIAGVRVVYWRDLYAWFCHRRRSFWAEQLVRYMESFESRMIARDYAIRGTITMFNGLHFDDDHPYTYSEGKRLIKLLGDQLQQRRELHRIGVDPRGKRRAAITGRGGDVVWDYLPLRVARGRYFTDFPHLTIDIARDHAAAAVTVPNGVKGGFRTRLKREGEEAFIALLGEVFRRMRPVIRDSAGVEVRAYALQRHFLSQRSGGIDDARLNANLATIVPGGGRGVHYQPQWISAIYRVLTQKRSNIQFGLIARFSYDCPRLRSPKAADLFVESWRAMSPLLDFVLA